MTIRYDMTVISLSSVCWITVLQLYKQVIIEKNARNFDTIYWWSDLIYLYNIIYIKIRILYVKCYHLATVKTTSSSKA